MKLVQWTPTTSRPTAMRELDREFDSLMNWVFGPKRTETNEPRTLAPAMDFVEEDGRYVIHFDLPGLKKDQIEVTYRDNLLTVRGERRDVTEMKENDKLVRQERYFGTFERSLHLPEKVDASRVEARFEDGVLRLEVPFLPEAQPVRLQIQ